MRTILAVFLLAATAACATTGVGPQTAPAAGSSATGASSARAAVDEFFAAIRAGDIQATSAVWGSRQGPAREWMQRDLMETRIIVMQCYLTHEAVRVVSQPRQKTDSVFYKVELTRGQRGEQSDVITVAGPGLRWYVASATFPQVAGCVLD